MAENIWTVEKAEVDYSKPEATYFGVTEKNGTMYRDEQKVDLNEAMLQSFLNPNMQQWQGFVQAVNSLTGTTDWVVDSTDMVVKYYYRDEINNCKYLSYIDNDLSVCSMETATQLYYDRYSSTRPEYKDYTVTSCNRNSNDPELPAYAAGVCYANRTNSSTGEVQTVYDHVFSEPNPNYKNEMAEGVIHLNHITVKISEDTQTSLLAEAYIDEVAKSFVTPIFDDSIVPTEVPDFVCPISEDFINYQEKARGRYTYILDTPEFDALVQTLLEQRMERQCQYLMLKDSMFDIDKSKGSALDQIGRLVGQPRMLINFITDPYFGFEGTRNAQAYNIGTWYTLNAASRGAVAILDDEMYKRTIKARIIKNGSNNSRSDLLNVLNTLGGGMESVKVEYTSHGNILITLNEGSDPDGLISYFLSRVMREDSIIPRQLGYRIKTKFEV